MPNILRIRYPISLSILNPPIKHIKREKGNGMNILLNILHQPVTGIGNPFKNGKKNPQLSPRKDSMRIPKPMNNLPIPISKPKALYDLQRA